MTPPAPAASSSASPRLLVVDDEPDLRTLYELTLLREGYDVECAGSVGEAWAMLAERRYQLVITDMRLPDGTGLELLHRMEEAGRGEKAMVITAYASPENAVEALKAGAYDYLTKPVDLRQFRAVVASAMGRTPVVRERPVEGRASTAAAPTPRAATALARLAGESLAMQQVRSLIEKVSRSMAPVLVAGESGTGKELVARAIHDTSPRGAAPFVAVNCGAIPEALLEAEFFGFRKGAFTGAHEDRDGFFQAAQGGTLFLDEIGDLPIAMQSKLLRVIQERAVRQLGAAAEVPVNVRIVSATHRDLGAEVQGGRFRQDLYYRLNVIRIAVPPLRERIADLPAICGAVLERIARDAGVSPVPNLAPEALQHLLRHPFPGNVRELENLLHRALALSTGSAISRADLGLVEAEAVDIETEEAPATAAAESRSTRPAPDAGTAANVRGAPAPLVPLPTDLAAHLDNVERDILERALVAHRFNRTAAGASMGLSLRQMRYRMARLGVMAPESPLERAASGPSAASGPKVVGAPEMPRAARRWHEGWWPHARRIESPNESARPPGTAVSLVVLHSISLPPGEYGGDAVERLFTNRLDPQAHPAFAELAGLKVSAHFFVRRGGAVQQFVSCDRRAWHAGVSAWRGRANCNDWSIGIELEGLEGFTFEASQYDALARLLRALAGRYPLAEVTGHEHVAPGRKGDPGPGFDWASLGHALRRRRPALVPRAS